MGQVQRVVVLGMGGAGKSVLARRLGVAWTLPVLHLDAVFWGPGWRPTPPEVWREVVAGLAAGDRWVIEGAYPEVLEVALPKAQLAVFLDLPRRVTLPRLVLRPLRPRSRVDLPRGLDHVVDRENLGWAWRWSEQERPAVLAALAAFPGEVEILRSPTQVRRWRRSFATPHCWLGAQGCPGPVQRLPVDQAVMGDAQRGHDEREPARQTCPGQPAAVASWGNVIGRFWPSTWTTAGWWPSTSASS